LNLYTSIWIKCTLQSFTNSSFLPFLCRLYIRSTPCPTNQALARRTAHAQNAVPFTTERQHAGTSTPSSNTANTKRCNLLSCFPHNCFPVFRELSTTKLCLHSLSPAHAQNPSAPLNKCKRFYSKISGFSIFHRSVISTRYNHM
jgi:hypothetical protein